MQMIFDAQKKYFLENNTKPIDFRIFQLKKLRNLIKSNEELIFKAISQDFGKSEYFSYISEVGLVYHELKLFINNLNKWASRRSVPTDLFNLPGFSHLIPEPLGVSLIISPWNYPFQLSLSPLIAAIGAGNTAILKPSELTPHTSAVLCKIINSNFSNDFLYVCEGGVKETTDLLNLPFDKIFFTGSTRVGKIVAEAAAKNLTPCTLELGGKSPTFVFNDADQETAAKRIVWGKFLNAGQTCIAPDYVLVEEAIHDSFVEEMKKQIKIIYENKYEPDYNYNRIINDKNFQRLEGLIKQDQVAFGGITNPTERTISPTILTNVQWDDPIMKDEIFGPLLPVLKFSDLDKVLLEVKKRDKPLALYMFTNKKEIQNKILNEVSFGSGAINETVMYFANSNIPFGGVGTSGYGSYHGEWGFKTFSHMKGIVDRSNFFEAFLKYPPFTKFKLNILRKILE